MTTDKDLLKRKYNLFSAKGVVILSNSDLMYCLAYMSPQDYIKLTLLSRPND